MASINPDEARNLFELLKAGSPVVEIGNFRFKESGSRRSPACTVEYKGEKILRKEFDQLGADHIIDILDIPSTFDNASTIGDKLEWTHVEETNHLREWKTPLDGNSVYIQVDSQRRQSSFQVHAPVEDKSVWKGYGSSTVDDVAKNGRTFESMEAAFVYVANYMSSYNPYEIDRLIRMEDIARDEFKDITGVGEKRVNEVVEEEHIRTFEEFKHNVNVLSRNYREDAKEDLEAKIESGNKIPDNSYVQEVSAKIAAKNI